jgi:hypothetical protein
MRMIVHSGGRLLPRHIEVVVDDADVEWLDVIGHQRRRLDRAASAPRGEVADLLDQLMAEDFT